MNNNPYRQQIVSMLSGLKKPAPPIAARPPVMKPPAQQVQPPPVKRGY